MTNYSDALSRLKGRYQRSIATCLFRRRVHISNVDSYISFTFDDFPRSALYAGGAILSHFGLRATYYASLGLMGTEAPTGKIFVAEDLKKLLADRHELGCHTFAHCHSWETSPSLFDSSITANKRALDELLPGAAFQTMAYPIAWPRPGTKYRVGRHFRCCRGGGQTFNVGATDLNLLKAYFLEKSRDNSDSVKSIIRRNRDARGWLIFGTHDISETPTDFGCTPAFFEEIVKSSIESGAKILPVSEALTAICRGLTEGP